MKYSGKELNLAIVTVADATNEKLELLFVGCWSHNGLVAIKDVVLFSKNCLIEEVELRLWLCRA